MNKQGTNLDQVADLNLICDIGRQAVTRYVAQRSTTKREFIGEEFLREGARRHGVGVVDSQLRRTLGRQLIQTTSKIIAQVY